VKIEMNIVTSGNGTNRDKITDCQVYIAIVTPNFVSNDKCLGEMKDAQALKKEMFALVDKLTCLPSYFFYLDWRLVLFYSNKAEFEIASEFLKKNLEDLEN